MGASRITIAKDRISAVRAITGLPRPVSAALAVTQSLAEPLEALRDARRLKREHPRMLPDDLQLHTLKALHDRYVAEVSSSAWAISWESVRYLAHICRVLAPARVLDLGSGFSSLALRHYAASAGHAVSVVSVDDNPRWLDTTRDYLEAHGYSAGELRLWSEFAEAPGEPFDVVFHDLASGDLRESAMAVAVRSLSPHGVIVFDDAQHLGHRRAAQRAARDAKLATYSLYRWTADDIGRYALLAAP
jgi:predicted O-methyltransferase YrrM